MSTASTPPKLTRVYQNHHLDSTRWELFEPREGDVVVTTSYKSGTTWMQQILLVLLRGGGEAMPQLMQISPWIDARFHGPREALAENLRSLPSRRFVKSHLPLDGLPWYPEVKYLIVGRDPRDVFMSLLNHYGSYTETAFAALNETPGRVGPALQPCPEDPRALWRDWITRGWFEWESEGYPFWSNLHHTQTYWNHRELPNFLFVHYADLLADLEGQVRRIARYLEVDASDELIARTVELTTFANIKKVVDLVPPADGPEFFRGGLKTFFFKGSNGRWRELLTEDDLALYEEAKRRLLSPDCADWLERGGPYTG
jgi:aryl sulfotransferase